MSYQTTSHEIARILKRDLGSYDSAIRYAESIARMNGECSSRYFEATMLLKQERDNSNVAGRLGTNGLD